MKTLQPWIDNPYRLISWLDMLKFSAEKFVDISASMQWMQSPEALRACGFSGSDKEREQSQKHTTEFFYRFSKSLSEIGCAISATLAHELGFSIVITKSQDEWIGKLEMFRRAVSKELSLHLFLWVPAYRAGFYEGTEGSFSDEVKYRFPKALPEIRSAGQCLALGCPTASVFHLMRVMELGLKAVGKSLGVVINRQDTWDNILWKIGKEEIKKDSSANALLMADLSFYQGVRQTISGVKDAVRNPTMHFDRSYDESENMEILTCVRAFLRGVAEKIDQDGTIGGPGPLQPNEIQL